ncbi:MAG: hypothetical protein RLY86_700 [Pseudomonadota bacterium]
MGIDPATLPEAEERVVWVWPENWAVFRLFVALSTQWRWFGISGLGGGVVRRTGLDYAAVPALAQAFGVSLTEETWTKLRLCEGAAMEVWDAQN